MKDKSYDHSINVEEVFNKTLYFVMMKTLSKMSIEEMYLNVTKTIYDQPSSNIMLNSEKLKAFSLRLVKRQGCPI